MTAKATRLLTTTEVARLLGISPMRVRQLISNGLLPAVWFGRDYSIRQKDVEAVKGRRKPGRPRKDIPD